MLPSPKRRAPPMRLETREGSAVGAQRLENERGAPQGTTLIDTPPPPSTPPPSTPPPITPTPRTTATSISVNFPHSSVQSKRTPLASVTVPPLLTPGPISQEMISTLSTSREGPETPGKTVFVVSTSTPGNRHGDCATSLPTSGISHVCDRQ